MALTARAAARRGGNDVPPPTSRRIHYDIPLPEGVDKGKVSQPTFLDMVARMKDYRGNPNCQADPKLIEASRRKAESSAGTAICRTRPVRRVRPLIYSATRYAVRSEQIN